MLFNTDSEDNLKTFHENFAGKMDYYAFVNLFRESVEKVPHGFMVIDNDPKVSYDEKFYFGVAEEMPFDIDHIIGCKEMWKESVKQLEKIADGGLQKRMERISKISKPGDPANSFDRKPKKDELLLDDVASRKRPIWDTSDYTHGGGGGRPHKISKRN